MNYSPVPRFVICKADKNVSYVLEGFWEAWEDGRAAAVMCVGPSIKHSGISLMTDGKRRELDVSYRNWCGCRTGCGLVADSHNYSIQGAQRVSLL